jgi:ubiquinol-cytochrome c reductase cytochrome b subunit
MECHTFHDSGEDNAPSLTGYGSREWLIAFITNPEHERFYGEDNDRMPAFGEEKSLTPQEIGLVADWIRGEWYVPPVPVSAQ